MRPEDEDERFMAAALAIGRRGQGLCAPNPAVGALIVTEGVTIARGWTKRGGRPHAETEALSAAGVTAQGATLYVSLEPCSHHGATPPCTQAIIAAGIRRVVYAVEDRDPRALGKADGIFKAAGLEVKRGVLVEEAARAHRGHFLRVTEGRPMLTLKLAVTADLYAGGLPGEPRLKVTGEVADDLVHMERARHEAVMVGIGTALSDDPLLTVRLPGLEARKPLRIVLDSELRLPHFARLATTALGHPTLVITGEDAPLTKEEALRRAGIEILRIPRAAKRRGLDLEKAFKALGDRGLTRVFCEGGPTLAAGLIHAGLADEVMILTSPVLLGRKGILGLDPATADRLADARHYRLLGERTIGSDRLTLYEKV